MTAHEMLAHLGLTVQHAAAAELLKIAQPEMWENRLQRAKLRHLIVEQFSSAEARKPRDATYTAECREVSCSGTVYVVAQIPSAAGPKGEQGHPTNYFLTRCWSCERVKLVPVTE